MFKPKINVTKLCFRFCTTRKTNNNELEHSNKRSDDENGKLFGFIHSEELIKDEEEIGMDSRLIVFRVEKQKNKGKSNHSNSDPKPSFDKSEPGMCWATIRMKYAEIKSTVTGPYSLFCFVVSDFLGVGFSVALSVFRFVGDVICFCQQQWHAIHFHSFRLAVQRDDNPAPCHCRQQRRCG